MQSTLILPFSLFIKWETADGMVVEWRHGKKKIPRMTFRTAD